MMKRNITTAIVIVLLVLGGSIFGNAQTDKIYYVSADRANDLGDGLSWETAKKTIQSAIDSASGGDEVWVTQGIYHETITLKQNVSIFGGFINEESQKEQRGGNFSTIDASGLPAPNHVVTGADNATIDGFIITGGKANGTTFPDNSGGGMFNNSVSPVVIRCIFTGNSAETGAGMFNEKSSPQVTNCLFYLNTAENGGGMYNLSSSSPSVTNCTFSKNSVTVAGGGIYNTDVSSPMITNCILWDNTAVSSGNEIYNAVGSTPNVRYSNIRGWPNGVGNIDSNPMFADAPSNDFHLSPGSPCIDAGTSDAVPSRDFEGDERHDDPDTPNTGVGKPPSTVNYYDIGADEFVSSPVSDTYYMDITNGDNAYDGTSADTPWKTLHYAISRINEKAAGTYTLRIRPGTYNIENGEQDAELIITQNNLTIEGTEDVVISGSAGGEIFDGIKIAASNVTIRNLAITGFTEYYKSGINITGSENIISGCSIYNNWSGITIQPESKGNIIRNNCNIYNNTDAGVIIDGSSDNQIHDNRRSASSDIRLPDRGVHDNGLEWSAGIKIINGAANNSVYDNDIYWSGIAEHPQPYGILIKDAGTGNVISDNAIYGHKGEESYGINVENSALDIKRNVIHDNYKGIYVSTNKSFETFRIWNNLIYDPSGIQQFGIYFSDSSELGGAPLIYHNTIVGGGDSGIYIEGGTPDIKYNIIGQFANAGINVGGGEPIIEYNDVYGNETNYSGADEENLSNTNISADPLFKDAGNNDYHLKNDSPCLDTIPQAATNPVKKDADNNDRPFGDGYDMGCYESQEIVQYTLTVTISHEERGAVTADVGITCSGSLCTGVYNSGTDVTLTASPTEGYQFTYWKTETSGDFSNPATITIDADKTVVAVFNPEISGWTQINSNGLGNPDNHGVSTMAVYNNSLYMGTANSADGFEILKYDSGTDVLSMKTGGIGNLGNTEAASMAVYKEKLYVGTTNSVTGAEVWEYDGQDNWNQVNTRGFGDSGNTSAATMAVYDDFLYVGTENKEQGAGIWKYDGTAWTRTDTFWRSDNERAETMAVYNGKLYVGTRNTLNGAEVWTYGENQSWSTGNPNHESVSAMAVYNGFLYTGSLNTTEGAGIWKYDGSDWTQVITPNLSDSKNISADTMVAHGDYLYLGSWNPDGDEVREYDGTSFKQINLNAFGNYYNDGGLKAMAVYDGNLYVGTWNSVQGTELWAYKLPAVSPVQHTLTVSVPERGGKITECGTENGECRITCPEDCSEIYDADTAVTLTASPETGYQFDHWEDVNTSEILGTSEAFILTMDSNKDVKAVFKQQYFLNVLISPNKEWGSVSGDNISCPDDCDEAYDATAPPATVTLTATPKDGYLFEHWEWQDGTLSESNPIQITMDSNKAVDAVFTKKTEGSISGHVYEKDGTTSVPNVYIWVEDYETGEWKGEGSTDENGAYLISDLSPGTYRVGMASDFCASDAPYVLEFYKDEYDYEQAGMVSVIPSENTPNIDFTLIRIQPRETPEAAIRHGLAWLSKIQNPDGSWGTLYALAKTALAVLLFEEYALDQGYESPLSPSYVYNSQVRTGLRYLFLHAHTINISNQPAGNPDTDGNGIGIYFDLPEQEEDENDDAESYVIYNTSIAMMAIAASSEIRDMLTDIPDSFLKEWTYKKVIQNTADYLAWAQTDTGKGRGGWRYEPSDNEAGESDQSNSGWAAIGLAYAQERFGITIPDFVRSELNLWIDFIQDDVDGDDNDGGSYYTDAWDASDDINILETGNLLQQMAFVGDTAETPRVKDAIDYLRRHWQDTESDAGWRKCPSGYHAAYTVMKGLNALHVDYIADSIDWFRDFKNALLSEQTSEGWWPMCCWDDGEIILSSEWAMLTLMRPRVTVKFALSVSISDEDGGTISGSGISCPGDCSETYFSGTPVTLTAKHKPGYLFDHWKIQDGILTDDSNPITIVMDSDRAVRAVFVPETDTTPPSVSSVSPRDNQNEIPLDTEIVITFSEPVDISTIIMDSSFVISDDSGNKTDGTLTYNNTNTSAIFKPVGLCYGTTYIATITRDVKDLAQNTLEAPYEWSFTTLSEPDTTRPEVISTEPADNAEDVAVEIKKISVVFSEPMDASAITSKSFFVSDASGDKIDGEVRYNDKNMTAKFKPAAVLNYETTYKVKLTTDVKDLAGNSLKNAFKWSFTTVSEPDTTRPEVVSAGPSNNTEDVSLNTQITAVFSEPMNASGITSETFSVFESSGNLVEGAINYDDATMTAIFKPVALNYDTTYVVTIRTDVRDLAGNALKEIYEWSFSTLPEPDTEPPVITSVSPENGAENVSLNTKITVTFSEPINASAITSGNFSVSDDSGNAIGGTLIYDNATMTAIFRPIALNYDTTYVATIRTDLRDLAGNPLQDVSEWSFSTLPEPDTEPPVITSVSPENGAENVSLNKEITVTFSEPINASAITSETFSVSDESDNAIGGTPVYDHANMTAAFQPAALDYDTAYTVTVGPGVTDLAGNPLRDVSEWSFSTLPEPDTEPPVITSVSPENGAENVSLNTDIVATFSEPINASTITSGSFSVSDDSGNAIDGTLAYDHANMTAAFQPAALDYDTAYTVTIGPGVTDLAGNSLQDVFEWSFSTLPEPDTEPPVITSVSPENGAENVSLNTNITVTFSEPMNPSAITSGSFSVSDDSGNAIGGTPAYDHANMTATFQPAALDYDTAYTVTIGPGVTDLAGNSLQDVFEWSFSTLPEPDTEPPVITSVSPENSAENVSLNTNITVTFSEPMNPSAITSGSFSVSDDSGNAIGGTPAYDHANMTAAFQPAALDYDTAYTVTIGPGVTDLAGNSLQDVFEWSFSTLPEPDTEPPVITSVSPENGAENVSLNTNITVTFSEPMNPSAITSGSFSVSDDSGNAIGGTPAYDHANMTATFRPVALDYETAYTVTIGPGVTDLAGNPLRDVSEWSFSTLPEPDTEPPVITSVSPENGAENVLLNTKITVTFSEPMNPSAITSGSFSVSDDSGNAIGGTPAYDHANMTATFRPVALDYETAYTVTIGPGVTDLAGNPLKDIFEWSFVTITEPDITPPEIRFVSPDNDADNVELDTKITVAFSEPVDSSSITNETFSVSDDSGNAVGGTPDYDHANMTATFQPAALDYDTAYTVIITTDVKDLDGNAVEADYLWSFTTIGEPFNSPPYIPFGVIPENEAGFETGPVTLESGIFSDIEGDSHIETHWLVRRADRKCHSSEDDDSFDHIATMGDLTRHTVTGLSAGLKYVWKVGYKDSGSENISWSEERTFKIGDETDINMQIAPGSQLSDYRMLSFSLWPNDPASMSVLGDDMGGIYDRDNFRIGTYDALSGGYIECGENMMIEPGKSYWFLARNGLNITTRGISVSTRHDIDVSLRYNPVTGNGWNMIACPNNADYYWEDVEVIAYNADNNVIYGPAAISDLPEFNNYIIKKLWEWEGGSYNPNTSLMKKKQGYWVKVKKENVYLRFPASFQVKHGIQNRIKHMISNFQFSIFNFQFPRQAIAESDESPPMPLTGLNVSVKKENGDTKTSATVGCFIDTVFGDSSAD
ncbi:Ig-like domain-containing protein [Desulfonema magnum]|nr:Ig-like domain-containing protein [Desulfonema magnum]